MTTEILTPQGIEKPPKGVNCWWTAVDYEKAYIKENYVAEISLLKAKIKKAGVSIQHYAIIVPIKKFGGQFISSYECNIRGRLDLTRKDKLVWIPIKTRSIYKDDSWWVTQIILMVQNRILAFKSAQTRKRNKLNRRIYDERLNSKLVVIP